MPESGSPRARARTWRGVVANLPGIVAMRMDAAFSQRVYSKIKFTIASSR